MAGAAYSLVETVVWRKLEEEAVLVDLETSDYYSFNASGARMLERLDRAATQEELADSLVAGFGLEPARARKDAAAFVSKMLAAGFLRESSSKTRSR